MLDNYKYILAWRDPSTRKYVFGRRPMFLYDEGDKVVLQYITDLDCNIVVPKDLETIRIQIIAIPKDWKYTKWCEAIHNQLKDKGFIMSEIKKPLLRLYKKSYKINGTAEQDTGINMSFYKRDYKDEITGKEGIWLDTPRIVISKKNIENRINQLLKE